MKLSKILEKKEAILKVLRQHGVEKVAVHNINSDDLVETGFCSFPLLVYSQSRVDLARIALQLEALLECRVDIRRESLTGEEPSCFARAAVDLGVPDVEQELLSLFNQGAYGKHKPPFSSTEDIEFDDAKRPTPKRKQPDSLGPSFTPQQDRLKTGNSISNTQDSPEEIKATQLTDRIFAEVRGDSSIDSESTLSMVAENITKRIKQQYSVKAAIPGITAP